MAESNNRSAVSEQIKTAALDRIRTLFDEQDRCGEVRLPCWTFDPDSMKRVFFCRLSVSDPAPADTEAECFELLSGILAAAELARQDETDESGLFDPEDEPLADDFPAADFDGLQQLRETWLDPLLDEQDIAEVGDYGFFRLPDEYCVCGETTPEERAAAKMRIGDSYFAADAIAHARRLCRLLQLNAPWIILQHAVTALAEALVLHRHAVSCIVIPIPSMQESDID